MCPCSNYRALFDSVWLFVDDCSRHNAICRLCVVCLSDCAPIDTLPKLSNGVTQRTSHTNTHKQAITRCALVSHCLLLIVFVVHICIFYCSAHWSAAAAAEVCRHCVLVCVFVCLRLGCVICVLIYVCAAVAEDDDDVSCFAAAAAA